MCGIGYHIIYFRKRLIMCHEKDVVCDAEKKVRHEAENWQGQLKRVMLAGLGAVTMAQEEFESFVNKLVEKGEMAEHERKRWVKDFAEKSSKQTKDTLHAIEENTVEGLEKLLAKLNIPNKKDMEALTKRIDELHQRVEGLLHKSETV